jgi:uncharacterized protein
MKRISSIILAFLAPFATFAQEKTPTTKSLLYEITGNNVKTSYLYGTIHVISKDDFAISEKIKRAFSSCKVLAMEVNLNMDFKTKLDVARQTILPDGKTLQDYMSPAEFARMENFVVDTLGLKRSKFKKYIRFKPFFFSSAVLQEQLGKTESYEEHFNKLAHKRDMQIAGLETINYQLDVVNRISIEEQVKIMNASLYEKDNGSFKEMVNLYKAEDTEALYAIISEETGEIPDFNDSFIVKRNKNWIPGIESLIVLHPTFIAVGAGHLGGPVGLIELLRKKGYTVKPVY